ncbi:MAG TPA: NAD(P)-binding domain-containing protein [Flavisolibacter sp.]|nr:NAD(P)-binding domain-containing protein [Flavisolibacter sp.]
MNIGVLGTGVVGETIATALTKKGHNVRLGSRTADNEKAAAWVKSANDHATQGTFDDAAAFGDILFFCLNGEHALDAARMVDPASVRGKILIDLTNPLDFSKGMPPRILKEFQTFSLGEAIQEAFPGALVVKTLNTVNCNVMVDPSMVGKGDHTLFICGNNADAKNKVMHFLVDTFGWKTDSFVDMGGLEKARMTEAYVPIWVTMMQALGTPMFNIKVVR